MIRCYYNTITAYHNALKHYNMYIHNVYIIVMLLLQFGKTALHLACGNGHTEVVKHLINNNANISAADNVSGDAVCLLYNCLKVTKCEAKENSDHKLYQCKYVQ